MLADKYSLDILSINSKFKEILGISASQDLSKTKFTDLLQNKDILIDLEDLKKSTLLNQSYSKTISFNAPNEKEQFRLVPGY